MRIYLFHILKFASNQFFILLKMSLWFANRREFRESSYEIDMRKNFTRNLHKFSVSFSLYDFVIFKELDNHHKNSFTFFNVLIYNHIDLEQVLNTSNCGFDLYWITEIGDFRVITLVNKKVSNFFRNLSRMFVNVSDNLAKLVLRRGD